MSGWIVSLAAAPVLFLLLSGRTFYLVDILHQHASWQSVQSRLLSLSPAMPPLWNPYMFCGVPLLADPQMQTLYPPSLIWRFLPASQAYTLFVAVHMLIAAAGMAKFLSAMRLSTPSMLVGVVAFSLNTNGFMLVAIPPALCGWAWLPWIAHFSRKLGERPSFVASVGLAMVVGWQILAGSPQYVCYGAVLSLAISFMFTTDSRCKVVMWEMVAGVFSLVLVSPEIVPFLEYLRETTRAVPLSGKVHQLNDFPLTNLMGYLSPACLGALYTANTFFVQEQWAKVHYLGSLPTCLAILGIRALGPNAGRQYFLIVLGMLLALGNAIPGGELVRKIPPLSTFRHASLWLFLVNFAMAWLAALGAEWLLKNSRKLTRMRVMFGLGGTSIFFGLFSMAAWKMSEELVIRGYIGSAIWALRCSSLWHPAAILFSGAALCFLNHRRLINAVCMMYGVVFISMLELLGIGLHIQTTVPAEWILSDRTPEERYLLERGLANTKNVRIFSWPSPSPPNYRGQEYASGKNVEEALGNMRGMLQPNLPAMSGLMMADGDNPLVPAGMSRLLSKLSASSSSLAQRERDVLEKLGVQYIITRSVLDKMSPVYAGYSRIYELEAPLPLVRLITPHAGRIHWLRGSSLSKWNIEAIMQGPGIILVSENYVSGWRLEGPKTGVVMARDSDGLLLVKCKRGVHQIRLVYDPIQVRLGFLLGTMSLTAILIRFLSRNL